jgi:branched-chain amino acid aminotransferase
MTNETQTAAPPRLQWPDMAADLPDRPADPRFEGGTAWVNGQVVPIAEATLPLLDLGFLRSDACQETISAWNGKFFRIDDHLDRFERSLAKLRMVSPLTRAEIRAAMHELVALGGFRHAYVQVIMTRGRPPIGSRDPRLCQNRFQAFCMPYMWVAKPDQQEHGLHLHVSDRVRVSARSVDPLVKHYHWLDFEMALFDAFDQGRDNVVLSDDAGHVTEGPGFNIFIVRDGRLLTPARGMLDGMTRRTTLELCAELGIGVEATDIPVGDLSDADEIFLTTTAGGLIPVTQVNGARIRDGAPGPVTVRLHAEYWRRRADGWHGEPITYAQRNPVDFS